MDSSRNPGVLYTFVLYFKIFHAEQTIYWSCSGIPQFSSWAHQSPPWTSSKGVAQKNLCGEQDVTLFMRTPCCCQEKWGCKKARMGRASKFFWSIECHVWAWSQSSFNPELVPAKTDWFINIIEKSELLGAWSRRSLHPSTLYPEQFGVVLTTCLTRSGHAVFLASLGVAGSCFSVSARTWSSRALWAPIPQPPLPLHCSFCG